MKWTLPNNIYLCFCRPCGCSWCIEARMLVMTTGLPPTAMVFVSVYVSGTAYRKAKHTSHVVCTGIGRSTTGWHAMYSDDMTREMVPFGREWMGLSIMHSEAEPCLKYASNYHTMIAQKGRLTERQLRWLKPFSYHFSLTCSGKQSTRGCYLSKGWQYN